MQSTKRTSKQKSARNVIQHRARQLIYALSQLRVRHRCSLPNRLVNVSALKNLGDRSLLQQNYLSALSGLTVPISGLHPSARFLFSVSAALLHGLKSLLKGFPPRRCGLFGRPPDKEINKLNGAGSRTASSANRRCRMTSVGPPSNNRLRIY